MAPYLFLYLMGYRINQNAWPSVFDADRAKAAAFVSLVIGSTIVFSAYFIAGQLRYDMGKSSYFISGFAIFICLLNDYVLNRRKFGVNFENRYDKLKINEKRKIKIISFGSYALLIIVMAAMYFNMPKYK